MDSHNYIMVDVTIDTNMLVEVLKRTKFMNIIWHNIKINVYISKGQQQLSITNLPMNNVKVVASNQAHYPNCGEVKAQLEHQTLSGRTQRLMRKNFKNKVRII